MTLEVDGGSRIGCKPEVGRENLHVRVELVSVRNAIRAFERIHHDDASG